MRRVRYVVAMSLNGDIAGPNGEADWIIIEPEIDFRILSRDPAPDWAMESQISS